MKVKGSPSPATKKGRRSSRAKAMEQVDVIDSHFAPPTTTSISASAEQEAIARGGVATPFPWKLHEMLEDATKEGNEHIVSWQPHGYSFIVHKPKVFVEKIMPTYFNQSKFASFQRQLNLYGFSRLTSGKDKGAYFHSCFVRCQVGLCRGMVRQKIKGTKVRRTMTADQEPDFYNMAAGAETTKSAEEEPEVEAPAPSEEQDVVMARRVSSIAPAPLSPSQKDVLSAKERAHKLRRERIDAVRDALKQTEILCKEDHPDFQASAPAIGLKAMVPSVSPLESEVSDCEDDSSSVFTPLRSSMPPFPNPPRTTMQAMFEPLAPRFATTSKQQMTKAQIKQEDVQQEEDVHQGDVLFFEGKPFRYLEHLDSLPPPAPSMQQKPKQMVPQAFGFPRDSLHSLMRVDPKALMGAAFNNRHMS